LARIAGSSPAQVANSFSTRPRPVPMARSLASVVVDERSRDAGLAGDVGDAQPRRPGLGDHPAGGVEDGVLAIGDRLGHHCLS